MSNFLKNPKNEYFRALVALFIGETMYQIQYHAFQNLDRASMVVFPVLLSVYIGAYAIYYSWKQPCIIETFNLNSFKVVYVLRERSMDVFLPASKTPVNV